MSKLQKPRLGRGLRSLLTLSDGPVEVELPQGEIVAPTPVPDTVIPVPRLDLDSPAPPLSPTAEPPADNVGQPLLVPIDSIQPNPHQPRRDIDEAKVAELAASIKSTGIIQPVVVRRQGESFQLIAGERRWRAARMAGLSAVPAVVRDVDGYEQAQMALVENIQREDLNPIDRARSYRALIDQLGLTQSELASRLGEERSSVANYLRMLDLAESVRELVRTGKLSFGHAKLLAGVSDSVEQQRLAELVVRQELSVRNLERVLAGQVSAPADPAASSPITGTSAHLKDLEQSLSRQLGLRVQLRAGARKGRGRMVVHYTSLDEFDSLLERLGVSAE